MTDLAALERAHLKEKQSKIGRASRNKGSYVERRIGKKVCAALGIKYSDGLVKRTPNSGGVTDRSDLYIASSVLPRFPFFVECKARMHLNVSAILSLEQVATYKPIIWYKEALGKKRDEEALRSCPVNREVIVILCRNTLPDLVLCTLKSCRMQNDARARLVIPAALSGLTEDMHIISFDTFLQKVITK